MSSEQPPNPIYLRAPAPNQAQPFEGDLFERMALAERLTSFLRRLPDGAVLSIDAPWGEGKSWFGRNWHTSLVEQGYRTAYIDCFERDYIEDPFVMIAGELLQLPRKGEAAKRTKLIDASKKLGAAILPSAAKFAANAAGHWLVGKADLGDEVAKSISALEDSSASALEKLVAKRLESYEADKKSVEGFRKALTEIAGEGGQPIVIFLDELDRCRPDFAVRTVERVKHFFEVPGVVFVLLMNRRQMSGAIRGIYGEGVDADAYLGKFIQFSLTLPKQSSPELNSPDDNQKHCDATLVRYGFQRGQANQQFAQATGVLASLLNLSLRDVERAVALYSLAQPLNTTAVDSAWPIAVKLARPDLFARLMRGQKEAHQEAYELAASLRARSQSVGRFLELFEELHLSGASNFERALPDEMTQRIPMSLRIYGPARFMSWLFGRVDLDVSR